MAAGATNDLLADRPRVFGIGLNKTGTSSFHRAMTILGLQSLHWGGPSIREQVEASLHASEPLLSRLDPAYDAFSDILPLSQNFELLDRDYQGSWFVLTVRPLPDWVDSRRRHVERNLVRKAAGEYHGSFITVDEDAWRKEWADHVTRVRDYFGSRSDFVEVDITAGAGWEPLCRLLGREVPTEEFPWENRHASDGPDPATPARPSGSPPDRDVDAR